MIVNLRTVLLAILLSSSLSAATLTINSTGLGFVDTGSGFQPPLLSGNLRVGLVAGQIDPGAYRAAFEFDIQSIDRLATIDSVSLLIWSLAPDEQQGRVVLSAYFGHGIVQASDVSFTFDTLALNPSDIGVTAYDVTDTFKSFFNIGTPFLGFSARQDPLGVCAVLFFGSCSTLLLGDSSLTPTLIVNYTPFTLHRYLNLGTPAHRSLYRRFRSTPKYPLKIYALCDSLFAPALYAASINTSAASHS